MSGYQNINNQKSLRASFLDGIFASIMFGFTGNYITPFALLLGARSFQIGLLNSLPQLFGAIVQLKSAEVVERVKSRVRAIAFSAILQAFLWLSVALVVFFPKPLRVEIFILLVTLSTIAGSILAPAWLSLMGDTVEKGKYGEYFSWRGRILGIVTLISNFVAGFLLFAIENKFFGFALLFIAAAICRVVSGIYLSQMKDIPIESSEERKFNYWQFIKRVKESNFVKFVLFVSLINFATFIAAPFFSVYMLDELKFKYSTYTIITTAGALGGFLFLPLWGKLSDRFGNIEIVKTTARFTCLLPLLWLFSKNPAYLVFINIFAGYIWSGFNLSAVNFIFDAASSEVRTRCAAYFNFTNGVFIFLGVFLGGLLATYLPNIILGSTWLTLFFLSGVLRFLVVFFWVKKFKEVRAVSKIEEKEMLYIALGIKPVLSLWEGVFYLWKKITGTLDLEGLNS